MARTKQTTNSDAPKKQRALKAPAPDATAAKRAFRFRPGTVSLREIRRYQKSTANLLQKLPFQRVVREVSTDHVPDMRFQASALAAIQDATESLLVSILHDANAVAIHSKRKTVEAHDVKLVCDLRKSMNC